mmetsp:Transcript_14877/g.64391  ORF Transcript_14877/g.64391 Transcript_14877/m.64391 type:complete len:215 (+) Transcript_14877:657-1301(+)
MEGRIHLHGRRLQGVPGRHEGVLRSAVRAVRGAVPAPTGAVDGGDDDASGFLYFWYSSYIRHVSVGRSVRVVTSSARFSSDPSRRLVTGGFRDVESSRRALNDASSLDRSRRRRSSGNQSIIHASSMAPSCSRASRNCSGGCAPLIRIRLLPSLRIKYGTPLTPLANLWSCSSISPSSAVGDARTRSTSSMSSPARLAASRSTVGSHGASAMVK